jgi:hypothetical protein
MTFNDDQVWIDGLAGRVGIAHGSETAREAEVLRAEILARLAAETVPVATHDPAREDRLIERARREGLLPERAGTAEPAAPDRRGGPGLWSRKWRVGVTVAALACAAVVVGLVLRPATERQVVRGAPGGIVRLQDREPEKLQKRILAELRDAGVPVTGYERLGMFGVDADLPQPLTPQVRRVLYQHNIPAPADGVLRVEVSVPPQE